MNEYLRPSTYIDWHEPEVSAVALNLAQGLTGDVAIAKKCFEFVRDQVRHSVDFKTGPLTCKASDVLRHRTGYCYAKSHLLAALLRANGIPAALCYQRLTLTDAPPFCLHGLNAVYLKEFGWYRLDARGNKEGVDAQFQPPVEQLAFAMVTPGENLFDGYYAEPLAEIVQVLTCGKSWREVYGELPDMTEL